MHLQEQACDLEDIFGKKGEKNEKRRYHKRTSSGLWDMDRLTTEEEQTYKLAMGFFQGS